MICGNIRKNALASRNPVKNLEKMFPRSSKIRAGFPKKSYKIFPDFMIKTCLNCLKIL